MLFAASLLSIGGGIRPCIASSTQSRFMARSSRTNGTRSSGQYGSDRRAHVSLILRRFPHRLRTRGQSTRDTDSTWRERPSGQARGHCKRARPGRSRHVSCPDCDIRAFQWAAKGAAHTAEASACSAGKLVRGESIAAIDRESCR